MVSSRWFNFDRFPYFRASEFRSTFSPLFFHVCVLGWCVSIHSADSRSELCGTDTHHPRCVGCNRDLFLSIFESDFRLPFTPPLVACPVLHWLMHRSLEMLVAQHFQLFLKDVLKQNDFPKVLHPHDLPHILIFTDFTLQLSCDFSLIFFPSWRKISQMN